MYLYVAGPDHDPLDVLVLMQVSCYISNSFVKPPAAKCLNVRLQRRRSFISMYRFISMCRFISMYRFISMW